MRKTLPASFILVAFLFFFVSSSFAEIKTGAYSFSPFIGGYMFEGNENLNQNRPVAGFRVGYDFTKNWGVEGLFEYTATEYDIPALTSKTSVFGYRLEALYNFMPERRWVPYLAVGAGGRSLDYDHPLVNNRNQVALDYGAGLKYFLYSNVALRGDVRHIITLNDRFNNLEYTLGVSLYFGGPKQVASTLPQEQPALSTPLNLSATAVSASQINVGWNTVAEASGYKIYRNGSYLTSSSTATLPDAGLKAETRYCYKVTATDDAQRESVQSNEDCATTPAPPALSAPINLSAMPVSESQIDLGWNTVYGATGYKIYRDGSYLASSATANAPDQGLKPGIQYCYRVSATDKTGRDSGKSNESCATTPAPVVMEEQKKEAAAAAVAKEMIEKGRATIDIEFDFDKAVVKDKYHDELEKFARVMKNHPDLKVVIEGHTDNIGKQAYNQKLSERRAESIKSYMEKNFGINGSRLTAKGYGMSKPIDTNKTKAGRQKNRRVEAAVDYMIKK